MGTARLVAGAGAGALAAVMAAQVGPFLATFLILRCSLRLKSPVACAALLPSQPLFSLCMPRDDLP